MGWPRTHTEGGAARTGGAEGAQGIMWGVLIYFFVERERAFLFTPPFSPLHPPAPSQHGAGVAASPRGRDRKTHTHTHTRPHTPTHPPTGSI